MKVSRAIALAGGEQKHLVALFRSAGYPCAKQTVSVWVKNGRMPQLREFQLREIRPEWFKERSMAKKKVVTNPKPRRPPNNLASAKGVPTMKGTKVNIKGPPFRPDLSGTPETKI